MNTQMADKNEVMVSIADAVAQLAGLMSAVADNKVNIIPYEGSWTAPQLLNHVTKSIEGMSRTMQMDGKPAERDPAQRVEELKKIFLDFSTKMNSPDFIVPEDRVYEKQLAVDQLNESFTKFEQNVDHTDLGVVVEGLPFGPVTKLEIVYFTLFHTMRHLQQMRKIAEALK